METPQINIPLKESKSESDDELLILTAFCFCTCCCCWFKIMLLILQVILEHERRELSGLVKGMTGRLSQLQISIMKPSGSWKKI